jgi:NADPH:quinone reductase-like Zn-dependent oxidoreductase
MKAILYHQYGSPDMLKLEDVERPFPKNDEVLIKVHAASVNSWDWDLLRGRPYIVRLGGLRRPKLKILGADVAGVVEDVGSAVKTFKQGDAVFGDLCNSGWGGFAEYVCASEKALTLKPPGVTFEDAAAVPQAGVMAMQGIRDMRTLHEGDKVLINGAGGGVGTYAMQLAKLHGAEVTGVDHADKMDLMKSLGADHVIDYNQQDFITTGKGYDLILDVTARRSIFDYRKALRVGGVYVVIGGKMSTIFQFMFLGPLISSTGNKKMKILIHEANKNLSSIIALVESFKIKSVIHRCYSLEEVPLALKCLGDGKAFGKIVIRVAS